MAESVIKAKSIVKKFSTGSFSVNTYYSNRTIDVSLTGYTPIAVVGWASNQANGTIYKLYVEGNTLNIGYATTNQINISGANLDVYVMYV